MARGTWQGSGTWKTSGPDLGDIFGPVVLVAGATAVIVVVLEFIWYIAAFAAAVLIGLVVATVVYRRKARTREAVLEATRAERHAAIFAAEAEAEVTRGTPPAIVNHYHGDHYHIYGPDYRELPGIPVIPGRVISSKEERP